MAVAATKQRWNHRSNPNLMPSCFRLLSSFLLSLLLLLLLLSSSCCFSVAAACNICGDGNVMQNPNGLIQRLPSNLPFDYVLASVYGTTCEQLQALANTADNDAATTTDEWCRTEAIALTKEPCECTTQDDNKDDNNDSSSIRILADPWESNCSFSEGFSLRKRFECLLTTTIRVENDDDSVATTTTSLNTFVQCDYRGDFDYATAENCACQTKVKRNDKNDDDDSKEKFCACSICNNNNNDTLSSSSSPVTIDCSGWESVQQTTLPNNRVVPDAYIIDSCTSLGCDLQCNASTLLSSRSSSSTFGRTRLDTDQGKQPPAMFANETISSTPTSTPSNDDDDNDNNKIVVGINNNNDNNIEQQQQQQEAEKDDENTSSTAEANGYIHFYWGFRFFTVSTLFLLLESLSF